MGPRIVMLSLSADVAERAEAPTEAQRRQIAYASRAERVDIVVKTHRRGDSSPRALSSNLHVHPITGINRLHGIWQMYRAALRSARAIRANLIVTQDPFYTGPIGLLLARRLGLPLCVHYLCDFVDNPFWLAERYTNRWLNGVARAVLRRATVVRIDSEEEKNKLARLGVDPARIHYVPFLQVGLDAFVDAPRDEAWRRELLGADGRELVLFVGRLEPQKDLDTLLQVIARVHQQRPGVRLVIVGDGDGRRELERTIRGTGLQEVVRCVGWVPFERLPSYFAAADLFLLTSRYETAARVLVLARASGLPIVSTRVSGTASLVRPEEGGLTAPVGDVPALAAAVLDTLQSADSARAAARASRGVVLARFDQAQIVSSIQSLNELALAGDQATARPRLCYVLPKYDAATEEHFFHTYRLLEELSRHAELAVIVERSTGRPVLGLSEVHVQRWARVPSLRLLEIVYLCARLRLRGFRCYYVHYSYFGALAAWLVTRVAGGRLFYWHCVSVLFQKQGWSRDAITHRLKAELPLRLTMRLVDVLVTGTPSLARFYDRTFRLSLERIRVVPNEIDPDRFLPDPAAAAALRSRLRIGSADPVVLFVHRLVPRKGSHYLPAIAAGVCRAAPNVRFVIVGDGPGAADVRQRVEDDPILRERVRLVGWVANADVAAYYALAAVFIMPSEEEGFPRVLLESMASGVPFVASDIGGVRDICTPLQQRMLVPVGHVDQFIERVLSVLGDASLRHSLREDGWHQVRLFTTEAVALATLHQLGLLPRNPAHDSAGALVLG